jgi:hypothetical protein
MSLPESAPRALVLPACACAAALCLHAYPLTHPILVDDDIQIVAASWTWKATWTNLWVPSNEHAMPLGRLSTWALVQLAGRPSLLPSVTAMQGPLALLLAMGLVYVFVSHELGHRFYGLAAMIGFGVTSVYQQAIVWFAASFSVLALDIFLLTLIAAQHWRHISAAEIAAEGTNRLVWMRRHGWLLLTVIGAALAPAWFASGILAGPMACVYLLPQNAADRPAWRGWLCALVPLAGTMLFLALSLPLTLDHIMHLEHYDGRTALESFDLLTGLEYTGRSVVENLALGAIGISAINCPRWLVPPCLAALLGAAILWWKAVGKTPASRRLLLLGVALVLASYWLVYSARAGWPYEGEMNQPVWGRYHLLPQLGLVLFLAAGLPRFVGRNSFLSHRPVRLLAAFLGILFLIHLPRGIIAHHWYDPAPQQEVLRHIEEVDARCREHRISADAARAALGWLSVPSCGDRRNGWELLRGSASPQETTRDEIRRLLKGECPPE